MDDLIVLKTIYEGADTFEHELEFYDDSTGVDVPINFDGYSIKMDLVRNETVYKTLSTENGGLIASGNKITIPSYKSDLPYGVYFFDFLCTDATGQVSPGVGSGQMEILNPKTK